MLQNIHSIFSWLLPNHCVLCQSACKRSIALCPFCEAHLPILENQCVWCGIFMASQEADPVCNHCLNNLPVYNRIVAPFRYAAPIDTLITRLKFNNQLLVAQLLGYLLVQKIKLAYTTQELPELIIPVPLHPRRLRERGYNQALEIARPIAKTLNIAIDKKSCLRVHNTLAQSSISADNRQKNIQGAFFAKPIQASHVAIIDDVVTTGHTVSELSMILKKAGVTKIDVWCCARTLVEAPRCK